LASVVWQALRGHLRAQALAEACVAGRPGEGSPAVVCRHSRPFVGRALVRAGAAAVAVAVVFRSRRCAAEAVGSSQAGRGRGLG
jgi:hypothetical protein